MNILLTGGAGYIGCYTPLVLSRADREVVLVDNFCNSGPSVLELLKKNPGMALSCTEVDVRETEVVDKVLRESKADEVIHFAGLKLLVNLCITPFCIAPIMRRDQCSLVDDAKLVLKPCI
jgi:UDP-glucose 4-epimerase